MQQLEHTTGMGGAERKRVEAAVETLAALHGKGESLAEVAHDARNMVTALGLYCDLLEEPGVLSTSFQHYGSELRLVATASRRLVEKLVALDSREVPASSSVMVSLRGLRRLADEEDAGERLEQMRRWDLMPAIAIDNLAEELLATRNLLAALAGPALVRTRDAAGGARPVRRTGEDLTRGLVNLVKNAAEAMPAGGRIQIGLRERPAATEGSQWLVLTVEDNGPGIARKALDKIFEAGYSSHSKTSSRNGGWPASHRGLGLSITRSILEAAGGRIFASNREQAGARFEIELPVSSR